ncbi:FAD-dependent monooxygenase [Streptomyces sp. NBC_00841]|uniref:FAD-dependent monooxygenase n=1 Tax=unclassified Streptomyces TaxID=2593676 RepID=UPI002255D192|nr:MULTISPECIES: FAD-dependent monooxygenase [unclassified Streptomyces]MCX4537209.1 FAD-dependent monooxygenase [Streptomyces sp. NBC_01669]WRZ97559.1 FAD-dependent monooxygenase [Streptomyces sp. NBC_00841]
MIKDVVIVGGGPNGLMLACELALAGARPVILESLPAPSTEPKANGLLGQVVRMIDRRGLYERLSGTPGPPQPNSAYFMFAAMGLNLSLLEDSPVYGLPAPQHRIVQVLEERATELGVEIRRGHKLVGLSQDDEVTLDVADMDRAYRLRARYVVGADGAHSITRKLSGINFPGITYDRRTNRTAHATVPTEWVEPETGALSVPGYGTILPFLPHRTEHGGFSYAPFPGHPPLVSTTEWDQHRTEAPMSLDELRASIRRVLGADLPLGPPTGEGPHVLRRLSGGNTRVAERFRDRRVFLVGDAAHVYTSGGGPGLNLGLQDAINLGWKLAAEIRGSAPPGLLDSYETERRQAAHRMVMYAQAQAALTAPGSDVTALRELFNELLGHRNTVQHLADLTAGTDIRYDMGCHHTHPLVGRFAPDMELHTPTGAVRLTELTRTARPLLLDLTEDASVAGALSEWHDQVDIVTAQPQPTASAATALLLRPDCYVAWASASSRPDSADLDALQAAMQRWFRPTETLTAGEETQRDLNLIEPSIT